MNEDDGVYFKMNQIFKKRVYRFCRQGQQFASVALHTVRYNQQDYRRYIKIQN